MSASLPAEAFWGKAAPCEHLIEVYKSESAFLEGLIDFASEGLARGESFVMLATAAHRDAVAAGLRARDHDLESAGDAYIALDAEQTLARFMVDGQPDAHRFDEVIGGIVQRAAHDGRPVRAFGEMVVLLWLQGRREATMRLEHLWNETLKRHPLTLFCAYPRLETAREITDDFAKICAAHSQMAFT
jgi:hypothetical protein